MWHRALSSVPSAEKGTDWGLTKQKQHWPGLESLLLVSGAPGEGNATAPYKEVVNVPTAWYCSENQWGFGCCVPRVGCPTSLVSTGGFTREGSHWKPAGDFGLVCVMLESKRCYFLHTPFFIWITNVASNSVLSLKSRSADFLPAVISHTEHRSPREHWNDYFSWSSNMRYLANPCCGPGGILETGLSGARCGDGVSSAYAKWWRQEAGGEKALVLVVVFISLHRTLFACINLEAVRHQSPSGQWPMLTTSLELGNVIQSLAPDVTNPVFLVQLHNVLMS